MSYVPKIESDLNRLSVVSLPKTKDLFSRFGAKLPTGVHVDDGTPILAPSKNDICDQVNDLASKEADQPENND